MRSDDSGYSCVPITKEKKEKTAAWGRETSGRLVDPPRGAGTPQRLGSPLTLTELPEQNRSHGGSRQDGPQGDGDAQRLLGLWGRGRAHDRVTKFL